MKKFFIRPISVLILLAMLAVPLTSCGNDEVLEAETDSVSTEVAEDVYEYFPEGVDFGGKEFNVMNCEREQWRYIAMFTSHEYLGSTINDAFYSRTMWIEETLNCTLVEHNMPMSELSAAFDRDVNSGACEYEASFLPVGGYYGSFMTKAMAGQLVQLDNVDTMHLDEEYYVGFLNSNMSLKNKHFAVASDAQLAYFEGSWALFFDVETLTNMQIDLPYDYVKNGTWTLELVQQMATMAATPDDTGSFDFVAGGSAIYGIAGHPGIVHGFLYGVNASIMTKDSNDFLQLNVDSHDYIDRAQAVGNLMKMQGVVFQCRPGTEEEDPTEIILGQRAAFIATEMFELKDSVAGGIDLGIAPYPKYNEEQENYMTTANYNGNYFVIPVSNPDPNEIGLIYDAMAWEAKKTFEQAYFVDHLELKMNTGEMEEDVEMLRIIRESMNGDPASFTGTGLDLRNTIQSSVLGGAGSLSSDIASAKTKTEKLLKSLDAAFK